VRKKNKSYPIRTCIFCGRKDFKENLIRITCFQQKIGLDKRQRLPGRGAYICFREECREKLATLKGVKRLARALRQPLNQETALALRQEIEEVIKRGEHGKG